MKRIFLTLALLACNFGYCLAGTSSAENNPTQLTQLEMTESSMPAVFVETIEISRADPQYKVTFVPEVAIFTKIINNTNKDITGIKLTIIYKNSFGDIILEQPIRDDTFVKANKSITNRGNYFQISKYNKAHDVLTILLENKTLKKEIIIRAIAFADGTVWTKESE